MGRFRSKQIGCNKRLDLLTVDLLTVDLLTEFHGSSSGKVAGLRIGAHDVAKKQYKNCSQHCTVCMNSQRCTVCMSRQHCAVCMNS